MQINENLRNTQLQADKHFCFVSSSCNANWTFCKITAEQSGIVWWLLFFSQCGQTGEGEMNVATVGWRGVNWTEKTVEACRVDLSEEIVRVFQDIIHIRYIFKYTDKKLCLQSIRYIASQSIMLKIIFHILNVSTLTIQHKFILYSACYSPQFHFPIFKRIEFR